MITAEGYENQSFGWFRILDKIGEGAEAVVFHCRHLPTGRLYALRLHVEDDAVWERSEPMLPPRNYTIEHNNARGAAEFDRSLSPVPEGGSGWTIGVAQLYGVRDNKYLLPVSNTFADAELSRLTGSLTLTCL